MLKTINHTDWTESVPDIIQTELIDALESGHVIFLPNLAFPLLDVEKEFLSPNYFSVKAKNISFNSHTQTLSGLENLEYPKNLLSQMMNRYFEQTRQLLQHLFPSYTDHLLTGRTSFRPVEIKNRTSSYRKDDRRLHVDAFVSSPNQGKRILRVFSNINPYNEDRVWRLGAPFEAVAEHFLPQCKPYNAFKAQCLRLTKLTKTLRTAYDHYMLQMHDRMKKDMLYQQEVVQQQHHFPPGSSWIVFSDKVSHAAMAGKLMMEQTYYLPIANMQHPDQAPLRILERFLKCDLV